MNRTLDLVGFRAVLLLLALLIPFSAIAQCGNLGSAYRPSSNSGDEFLLCFEQNATLADTDPGYFDIYLASTGDSATVTITCRAFPLFQKTLSIPAGGSTVYRISNDITPNILSSETVDMNVVHVAATASIICYGMNHKIASADAFLALPRNVATTDYRVMAYTNTPGAGPGDETQSQFSVAAFSNQTHVTITPAAQTIGGSVSGKPLSFVLDSAECVQIQGDPHRNQEDMTSSVVTSDKPVVVFGGHVCAEVPVSYIPPGQTGSSCDHLTEMMQPTTAWGENFVATNFAPRTIGDIIRVAVLNDNTIVTVNGVQWGAPLMAGQYRDTLITGTIGIVTSGPAQVGEFAHTSSDFSTTNGDPFFAIVPPVDQTYNDFTFFSSEDPIYTSQSVVIVAERSAKGTISIDNQQIPVTSFIDIPVPLGALEYSVATVALMPGSHHIVTKNDIQHGFTILAYGFGYFDSYGYTAGALLRPLRGTVMRKNPKASITPGTKGETTIDLRNILSSRVYLDSAVVTLSPKYASQYKVKIREDVASDIMHLEVGENTTLHFDAMPPNALPLDATVRIYTHSANWMDFKPTELKMTIDPQDAAGVSQTMETSGFATAYPNPFTSGVTISFALPKRADIALRVYDDLGRLVKDMANQDLDAGAYHMRFDATGVAPGHYYYELNSTALGLSERGSLILVR